MGQGASESVPSVEGYLEGTGDGSRRFLSGYPRLSAGLTETTEDRRQRITLAGDVSSLTDPTLASAD